MPHVPRVTAKGYVYHVLNRGVGRMTLFRKDRDFEAFLKVIRETLERLPAVELLCFCVMSNHRHLAVRPREDGVLSEFMRLLTVTHTPRWPAHRRSAGKALDLAESVCSRS